MDSHFRVDYQNAKSKKEAIFQGQKYRITVLTERLVRLEFNKNGLFFDDLTEQVINRNFPVPDFKVVEDDRYLEIITKYFMLKYQKEKPFESLNIEIMLLNTDKSWFPKNKEVRNFKTSGLGIDLTKPDYQKGLYSVDGFVSIDDSPSMIINEDGFLIPNQTPRTDLYVFMYRRDFGLCLRDYFMLTGFPELIPRYALGIWWHKNEIYNFNDITNLLNNFNRHGIPLSIIVLGEFWHLKDARDYTKYKTGFTFNRNLFSDPAYLTKYLHERGVRLGLEIDPKEGIMPHEDHYEEIRESLNLTDKSTIPFNVFDKFILNSYFHNSDPVLVQIIAFISVIQPSCLHDPVFIEIVTVSVRVSKPPCIGNSVHHKKPAASAGGPDASGCFRRYLVDRRDSRHRCGGGRRSRRNSFFCIHRRRIPGCFLTLADV